MAGNAGFLLRVVEPGLPTQTIFVFEESGKLRVFASREAGIPGRGILPGAQYFTQATSMALGNSWRFLDDDSANETVATVVAQENITTPAGSFSTFKVDVTLLSAPGTVIESLWFSSGVGYVLDEDYAGGVLDGKSWLGNFTIVGGSGYMPLAVGNMWVHVDVNVAVESIPWATFKTKYK